MIVRWTPSALRDLESLSDYISEDRAAAASAMVESILAGIAELGRHPEMGRTGRAAGTCELVIAPYVVAYRARRTAIEVLAIIHGVRRWPNRF